MSRKFSILVAFCVVLFGAILAGYWDMLDSEKLRSVRDQASKSVAELTGTRSDSSDATADDSTSSQPSQSNQAPIASSLAGPSGSVAAGSEAPGADSAFRGADGKSGSLPESGKPTREASLPQGSAPGMPSSQSSDRVPPPVALPSFDILRVEPDGSAVMAGRATPNADVRLMDGDKTIGSAKASPGGEFAIVLDDRLPAGDHQIRIEAAQDDGTRTVSQETAIVSVPRPGEAGELLAMVEAPNRPSRIITLPNAEPDAGNAPLAAGSSAPPAEEASRMDGTSADQQEMAAMPSPLGASGLSGSPASSAPAAPSPFAVEAVEIENGTVYIAGRAPGTAPVRVYIDNKLIGEDRTRRNGRFLVTAKVPLAVGDHQIRADMIKAGGAVASRVEVPFAKPEGDAMSAIASNDADAPRNEGSASGRQTGDASVTNGDAVGVQAGRPADAPSSSASQAAGAGAAGSNGSLARNAPTESVSGRPAGSDVAASEPVTENRLASVGTGAVAGAETQVPADGQEVATIRQPALEGVRSRVLIRRGDTLWRISRQAYGFGRRYTVIYVANGDQIRNPNRIYPGQVFRLPKDEPNVGQGTPTAVQ